MRVSDGLGLAAIFGFVACAASGGDTASMEENGPASAANQPAPGDTGSSTLPTEPVAPPPAPADPADPETPPAPLVSGITVTDVAMFQAVRVPVVDDGALVKTSARKAPVVAKRPGMLRIYVKPDAGWKPGMVTAELRLVAGDKKFPIIRDTKAVTGASKEEDPKSTFNLEVPGDSLPEGVTFQVALTAPDGDATASTGTDATARYPRGGGFESLGAEVSGKLRVVLVPVQYDGDGSGRTPAVGAAQLEAYKKNMMRFFPASDVELTAHAPLAFDSQISSNGNGFSSVLRAVTQLRQQDNVEKDVYYYGLLSPKASMAAYCGGGCVTGLSSIVDDPGSAGMRASVGIGFGDTVSANTMVHEIGHAHGRLHAPCGGPAGPDPKFPYSGGSIGVWGYDIFAKTLIAPTTGKDIMGYCRNEWISDYTYNALFKRISAISIAKSVAPPYTAPTEAAHYRLATASGSGELTWDGDIDLDDDSVAGAPIHQAKFLEESGAVVLSRAARFFRFDHLPGGFVVVPKDAAVDAAKWKAVTIEGFTTTLAR
ncbi:MAG TPA: M66 family metalloprotease [Labilithrix sp.]|nr:M66 family metalloprotease [Labilithrix sp.]